MKNFFVFILLIATITFPCFAQTESGHQLFNLVVKTDPVFPVVDLISKEYTLLSLSVEKQIKAQQSVELILFIGIDSSDGSECCDQQPYHERIYLINPSYRYYLHEKNSMEGFYLGGYLKYYNIFERLYWDRYPPIFRRDHIAFGGLTGAQWLFMKDRIALDIQLQLGCGRNIFTTSKYYSNPYFVDGLFNLDAGWRF